MKNCHDLAIAMAADYQLVRRSNKSPEIKLRASKGESSGFVSNYAAGTLSIDSANAIGHAYGIAQMSIAANAGHMAEYLGKVSPKFPLRPLWLGSDCEVSICDQVSIHLPTFMLNPNLLEWIPLAARRLIELGYNAILVGSRLPGYFSNILADKVDLESILKLFNDYEIKVILKPNFLFLHNCTTSSKCPLDENLCSSLQKAFGQIYARIPSCKGVFWESMLLSPRYHAHTKAKELTGVEVVIHEVQLLEKCNNLSDKKLDRQLIFYVPSTTAAEAKSQAAWIPNLLDEMGDKSIFAFSAVEGGFYQDHLYDHPLWQQLRRSPDSSSTLLLPIVNIGAVEQGEGLWPLTNFDLVERFFFRCRRHAFAGVIGVVNHLPAPGSLLDFMLWVAGQSMWHDHPPALLAETWFDSFRKGEKFADLYPPLKAVRMIVLELSLLRNLENNEERRRIGEPLIAQLKTLTHQFEKDQSVLERPSIKDYFKLFVYDIKRFLEQSLQLSCRTIFAPTFGNEDLQPSFWTHPKGRGDFLVKPQEGLPGSILDKIYKENRFL